MQRNYHGEGIGDSSDEDNDARHVHDEHSIHSHLHEELRDANGKKLRVNVFKHDPTHGEAHYHPVTLRDKSHNAKTYYVLHEGRIHRDEPRNTDLAKLVNYTAPIYPEERIQLTEAIPGNINRLQATPSAPLVEEPPSYTANDMQIRGNNSIYPSSNNYGSFYDRKPQTQRPINVYGNPRPIVDETSDEDNCCGFKCC